MPRHNSDHSRKVVVAVDRPDGVALATVVVARLGIDTARAVAVAPAVRCPGCCAMGYSMATVALAESVHLVDKDDYS